MSPEALRLMVATRVKLEVSEELSFCRDDPDVATRDQKDDRGSFERSSHPDVVQLALVADGDVAVGIDPVVTDA